MTPTLRSENDDRPRLEYYPANSQVLRTVVIEEYPFVIGRGDDTKLKVNSTSVSREHARLTRSVEGFQLEDLKSTNGTDVNGEPIDSVFLEDGDTVRIGEMELTFRCADRKASGLERMVTQPLAGKKRTDEKDEDLAILSTQRSMNETLLWQTVPLCRSRLVDVHSGSHQGAFISIGESIASQLQECTHCDPHSTPSRLQQLAWMIAARHADSISTEGTLFLRFDLHAGLDRRLCRAFELAQECLSSERRLGVLLHWEWAVQSPETVKLCSELKSLGAELAFDTFTGGATCIDSMADISPDLLVLSPSVARRITTNPRSKERLGRIIAHCNESGIRVVLPAGLAEEDHREICELGIDLALGGIEKPEALHNESPDAVTV